MLPTRENGGGGYGFGGFAGSFETGGLLAHALGGTAGKGHVRVVIRLSASPVVCSKRTKVMIAVIVCDAMIRI